MIAPVSHIALAAHENNGGIRILRRCYNYTDGINQFGQLDAGLLFIAYMNDPGPLREAADHGWAAPTCSTSTSPTSAPRVFAVPRGPDVRHYLAEALFA